MIAEDLTTTRARLRNVILRRQRGLSVDAEDELDLLVRIDRAFHVVEQSVEGTRGSTLEEAIGAFEDATHDAQSAASTLRKVLSNIRAGM